MVSLYRIHDIGEQRLASVSVFSTASVTHGVKGAAVVGEVGTDAIDPQTQMLATPTYLNVTWLHPRNTTSGLYTCEVMAIDQQGNPLLFTTSANVTTVEPSREMLLKRIDVLDDELTISKKLNEVKFPPISSCEDLVVRKNGTMHAATIDPEDGLGLVDVVCEFSDDGEKAWTVFQNRIDGRVDFDRDFEDYEKGFGNLTGDFWLGLKTLARLTQNGDFDLKVDMVSNNGTFYNRTYQNFTVGAAPTYRLTLKELDGSSDRGQGLSYNNGASFGARDTNPGCASQYKGGFWYNGCTQVNLNGVWGVDGETGMFWKEIHDSNGFYMERSTFKFRLSQNPLPICINDTLTTLRP